MHCAALRSTGAHMLDIECFACAMYALAVLPTLVVAALAYVMR